MGGAGRAGWAIGGAGRAAWAIGDVGRGGAGGRPGEPGGGVRGTVGDVGIGGGNAGYPVGCELPLFGGRQVFGGADDGAAPVGPRCLAGGGGWGTRRGSACFRPYTEPVGGLEASRRRRWDASGSSSEPPDHSEGGPYPYVMAHRLPNVTTKANGRASGFRQRSSQQWS
jgi:hypothetical protein